MTLSYPPPPPPPPPASTKLKGGYTGFTLSVCPSVDRIVSALYLQQYSSDPFHICTSYQATWEGVLRVMVVSKCKNLKFWWLNLMIMFWISISSNAKRPVLLVDGYIGIMSSMCIAGLVADDFIIWMAKWGMAVVSIHINTLRLRQNGCHSADDISKIIFFKGMFCISIPTSLKFVPKCSNDNKSSLVQVMAWCLCGTKPIPEPMMTQFTNTYVHHTGLMGYHT